VFTRGKATSATRGKVENILGANTTAKGQLKSEGNIRIDGMFEGLVETTGNVVIGQSAKVIADIKANAVQIWGAVKGNVIAAGRLEIMAGGRLWGNIQVSSLFIDEGAIFRGQSFMHPDESGPLLIEGPQAEGPVGAADMAPKAAPASTTPAVKGYCVKCKATRSMVNPYQVTLKNGRPGVKGKCIVCGATMFKFGELPTKAQK